MAEPMKNLEQERRREATPESGTHEVSHERLEEAMRESADAEASAITQEDDALGARIELNGGTPDDRQRLSKFDDAAKEARRDLDTDLAAAREAAKMDVKAGGLPGLMTREEETAAVQQEFGGKPKTPLAVKPRTMAPEGMDPNPPVMAAMEQVPTAAVAKEVPQQVASPEVVPSPAEKKAEALKALDAKEQMLQAAYAEAMTQLNADLAKGVMNNPANDAKLNQAVASLDRVRAARKLVLDGGSVDADTLTARPVARTEAMPAAKPVKTELIQPNTSDEVGSELFGMRAELGIKELDPDAKVLPNTIPPEPGPYKVAAEESQDVNLEDLPNDSDALVKDLLDKHDAESKNWPEPANPHDSDKLVAALVKDAGVKEISMEKTPKPTEIKNELIEDEATDFSAQLEADLTAWNDAPEAKWKSLAALEKVGTDEATAELAKRLTPESLKKEYEYVKTGTGLDGRVLAEMPEADRAGYLPEAAKNSERLADLKKRLKDLGVEVE